MSEYDPAPTSTNDRLWIVLCHLSLVLGFALIFPLIVYLVTKKDVGSPIPEHAKEALNFHISLFIYCAISGILCVIFIGFLMLFAIGIASVILSIVAAVKASNDEAYQYPMTLRLVK